MGDAPQLGALQGGAPQGGVHLDEQRESDQWDSDQPGARISLGEAGVEDLRHEWRHEWCADATPSSPPPPLVIDLHELAELMEDSIHTYIHT